MYMPRRTPVSVCTDRTLLERALRLGFTAVGFTGPETAFVCRDHGRTYAVQPLSEASPPPAGAEVTRIESGAADGGARTDEMPLDRAVVRVSAG